MQGADIIVSCAHSKFTGLILDAMPATVSKIVLTGSAWRYSKVANERADQVRNAERLFLESEHNGVMLHPTMIYGGEQENNIRRLLRTIRLLPIIPAPGGGHQIVQPIFIDDVVSCFFAAIAKDWRGSHVLPLAGPALTWREMVKNSAKSIHASRHIVAVPALPIIVGLTILNKIGIREVDANMVRRFRENSDISISAMMESLSVMPRDFETGIEQAVADWMREGTL